MPALCLPWNEDDPDDLPVIEARLRELLANILSDASRRFPPSIDLARAWHRQVHQGLQLAEPYYAGEVRDADPAFPCLFGYEVTVGGIRGVPSAQVPQALLDFEAGIRRAVGSLDGAIAVGAHLTTVEQLQTVIWLAALAHGEWIRIHPFANGNGRVARLWANWCVVRYSLPPFVRLRPRPEGTEYALAARESMRGDHRRMERVFLSWLGPQGA